MEEFLKIDCKNKQGYKIWFIHINKYIAYSAPDKQFDLKFMLFKDERRASELGIVPIRLLKRTLIETKLCRRPSISGILPERLYK
jgi:hypothetical protein